MPWARQNYARCIVKLSGFQLYSSIMSTLLTNQMTGILRCGTYSLSGLLDVCVSVLHSMLLVSRFSQLKVNANGAYGAGDYLISNVGRANSTCYAPPFIRTNNNYKTIIIQT